MAKSGQKTGEITNIDLCQKALLHNDLNIKIVLDFLKEEKSVTQLSFEYQIHYKQLLKEFCFGTRNPIRTKRIPPVPRVHKDSLAKKKRNSEESRFFPLRQPRI